MIETRLVAPGNTSKEKSRIDYDYVLMTHDVLCDAFEKLDAIIHDVARRKDVRVIDASQQITGKDELFANHIHLNEQGSEALANVVAAEFAKILREGKGR